MGLGWDFGGKAVWHFGGGVLGFGHFGDQGGILGCSPPPCAIAVPAALEGMRQHPEVLGGGGCVTPSLLPPPHQRADPRGEPSRRGALPLPQAGDTEVWGH